MKFPKLNKMLRKVLLVKAAANLIQNGAALGAICLTSFFGYHIVTTPAEDIEDEFSIEAVSERIFKVSADRIPASVPRTLPKRPLDKTAISTTNGNNPYFSSDDQQTQNSGASEYVGGYRQGSVNPKELFLTTLPQNSATQGTDGVTLIST